MAVYVGVLNLLFVLRFTLASGLRLRGMLYWPVLLALFVFSAYRWEVGCDWTGYLHQFQSAVQIADRRPVLGGREGLWWWLLAQLNLGGFAYPAVNVASSAIFFAGVHVLARRQPDPFSFLILLFPVLIINMPMSGIRQGAAIGVMCMAFVAFADRRPFRFAALTLLAGLFHDSALVFLLLAPLAQGRYGVVRLVLAAALAVPGLLMLLGFEGMQLRADRFIDTGREAFGGVFRALLLALTGAWFLLFLARDWRRVCPRDYALAHLGALMMLAIPAVLAVSSIIGDRLGYYLIPLQAAIFARIPWLTPESSRTVLTLLPYLTLALFFLAWTAMSRHFNQCYVPYDSWVFGLPAAPMGGF